MPIGVPLVYRTCLRARTSDIRRAIPSRPAPKLQVFVEEQVFVWWGRPRGAVAGLLGCTLGEEGVCGGYYPGLGVVSVLLLTALDLHGVPGVLQQSYVRLCLLRRQVDFLPTCLWAGEARRRSGLVTVLTSVNWWWYHPMGCSLAGSGGGNGGGPVGSARSARGRRERWYRLCVYTSERLVVVAFGRG